MAAPAKNVRASWYNAVVLVLCAGATGLFTGLVGLVAAGHGGPIWPMALMGGPWPGTVAWLDRVVGWSPARSITFYFGVGALEYAAYMGLLLGCTHRFGYKRVVIAIAAFHLLGAAWTLGMMWWVTR